LLHHPLHTGVKSTRCHQSPPPRPALRCTHAVQLEKDMKLWWPINEAMIAFAMAYEETLE
jgi:hypothetical protein